MHDVKKIWDASLNEIELSISKANFNTWFKNTHVVKEEDGVLYLGVPNEFVKEWLHTKYHKAIIKALRDSSDHIRGVQYVVAKRKDTEESLQHGDTLHIPSTLSNELPLKNLYIDKRDNLNPRYDFDSFIIGPFNELAYSASKAIINKPGIYNPLFIYGSTGLGKTHLIQAVGNSLKNDYPGTKVYYTSSENFTMELVNSIKNNRPHAFKEKYRNYDVLIIDDIQFISGKEKTQEELFHLFNFLYDKNKQIIFSSDKHPNYIPGLEERLQSRFSAGMIVDVVKPEFESKVAILTSKATQHNIEIDTETINYVAEHVEGNIRELEGILNSLIVQMQLKGRSLSIAEVKSLIKNNIKPKRNVSIKDLVKIIADFYNIEEVSVYEKTRRKEIVHCRQVVMYLLREDFNISYPLIGRELGGRDHTTVIHSYMKVKGELEKDTILAQEVEQLRAILST